MEILILPGDGIGPEITQAARACLEAANRRFGLGLDLVEREIGLPALEKHGSTIPSDVLEHARRADGVVLAPLSTFEYPPASEGGINPSAAVRTGLDLYANVRPAWTRPGVPSLAPSMDLVVVRENTEGFYADRNMALGSGEFMPTPDLAMSVRKITREGCTRIARAAFELAMRRRRKVTAVHKANVLKVTDGLFLECVRKVATDYPQVTLDTVIVDAMAALLVRKPGAFDVIVTTNMFGDILSDEAAELAGGLGLAPSINHGDRHGVAQAIHGSAPDIAGQGIANPTALILSVGMLLEWLGARNDRNDMAAAAGAIRAAVDAVVQDDAVRTPDLGGSGTTEGYGRAVAAAIAG
ncbi:MAG: isocitrate/isopropylmalate dehydrogenase family protein [Ectothiorhodospiraceae bacterium]|nr:isocitrate/isopropylmalate dehydrogenase family protein [Chromatiales bacterium]MCP5154523.1 isocitrate/isopropylmalate dehydrogenase family protein [Ectothiorhodospiraceae bacterium]